MLENFQRRILLERQTSTLASLIILSNSTFRMPRSLASTVMGDRDGEFEKKKLVAAEVRQQKLSNIARNPCSRLLFFFSSC